jgi:hypothetical protein
MGRTAAINRATDRDAGIVDRSAEERVSFEQGTGGVASLGSSGIEPVPAGAAEEAIPEDEVQASGQESQINPSHVWFQLSGPERQRFGQCFSLMVLKALGRRSSPFTEEQS